MKRFPTRAVIGGAVFGITLGACGLFMTDWRWWVIDLVACIWAAFAREGGFKEGGLSC